MPRSDTITARLTRIEALLLALVPPADTRTHMEESSATAGQVDRLSEASPIQGRQLDAIMVWLDERMSGSQLQFSFDDQLFITKQLTSILQEWRTDLLQLRSEIRRLSALQEQVLRARIEDDERRRG